MKIAKNIIRKASRDGKDLHMAILEWRNIPTQGADVSPLQKMFSRRTRGLLPMSRKLLQPEVPSINMPQTIRQRQERSKRYFDKKTKPLAPLYPGETIRIQELPQRRRHGVKWKLGTVVKRIDGGRSYLVKSEGRQFQRNRRHLRKTKEDFPPNFDLAPDLGLEILKSTRTLTTLQLKTSLYAGPTDRMQECLQRDMGIGQVRLFAVNV